jgi:hypothetical protein
MAALAHSEDILQQQSQSVQKIYIIILLVKKKQPVVLVQIWSVNLNTHSVVIH